MDLEREKPEDTVDPVNWAGIPNRLQIKLRRFFYDKDGKIIASADLIQSFNDVSQMPTLPGTRKLFPRQIAENLRIQATLRRDRDNIQTADLLDSMARSVLKKT